LSEGLDRSIGRVDLTKYIDQMEEEIAKMLKDMGQGKTEVEMDAGKRRIEELMRKQSLSLAQETGIRGSYMFVHLLMTSILSTAWVSFALKRGMIDMGRPFEERLRFEELLSSLGNVLNEVVTKSAEHADMYGKKP
jgi:hypothetical protein